MDNKVQRNSFLCSITDFKTEKQRKNMLAFLEYNTEEIIGPTKVTRFKLLLISELFWVVFLQLSPKKRANHQGLDTFLRTKKR